MQYSPAPASLCVTGRFGNDLPYDPMPFDDT